MHDQQAFGFYRDPCRPHDQIRSHLPIAPAAASIVGILIEPARKVLNARINVSQEFQRGFSKSFNGQFETTNKGVTAERAPAECALQVNQKTSMVDCDYI
jgi:hypothetical protein